MQIDSFCKKSDFRFTSCHAVFLLIFDLIETFKIMTGKERVDRSQFFQLSTCEYQLRGHTMKLSKQRTNLHVRKFSFSQRVVQEWKKLSQDVVEATSVNQFKNRLDKFWQRYGH